MVVEQSQGAMTERCRVMDGLIPRKDDDHAGCACLGFSPPLRDVTMPGVAVQGCLTRVANNLTGGAVSSSGGDA